MEPIRLRDFIVDADGWIYAVSTYDNAEKAGCVLRYVPDASGERVHADNTRYRKFDFEDSFEFIADHKPQYLGSVLRIPLEDIQQVQKPEREMARITARHPRVKHLAFILNVPSGFIGCTGSLLCGLENENSDIDLVVYGDHWFGAQQTLRSAIISKKLDGLSPDMWRKVYEKRKPEITYEMFVLHEERKWNRGQIDGTYFDLLFTRPYEGLDVFLFGKGEVLGKRTFEARVTDASLAFDSPAIYEVEHEEFSRVISFTHTYSGQALAGETIEARGVAERHGNERWLVVGTTREAQGEYIISKTLVEGE
ncbi:MAG: nucleotidyltransferase domain-containing protein [Methanoregula sp.]|nr:MAG: nucleotidyltransferase domain-containing protein [Methanoregula sp.]